MPEWSAERFADVGRGIELCYQERGSAGDPAILLVAGIGTQMISWPDGLCSLLAERGLRVIRFDNRDSGRSTWLADLGTPSVTRAARKELDDPPYLLSDMAEDCAGLLDALGVDTAHVVGASLGGFVAQTLAIEHPERVQSLASIMSSTGSGRVGQATPAAIAAVMTRPAPELEGYVEGLVAVRRVIGTPGFDEEAVRELARRAFERGINPAGTQRQLVASICSGDRSERLGELDLPTVVIHGDADPLIDVSGGRATAEAIPGAELLVLAGLAHDLPEWTWERIAGAVAASAIKGVTA